jgi:hypothetical protein
MDEVVCLPQDEPDPATRSVALEDAGEAWARGSWHGLDAFAATTPARELPRVGWAFRIVPGLVRVALNDVLFRFFPGGHGTPLTAPKGPPPVRPSLRGQPDARCSKAHRGPVARTSREARLMLYSFLARRLARTLGDDCTAAQPSAPVTGGARRAPAQPRPRRDLAIEAFRSVYRALPEPRVAARWSEPGGGLSDERFAWLRVAGPNPEVIRAVSDVPDGFPGELAIDGGESARDAARHGRLFLAAYPELARLDDSAWCGFPRWAGTPRALFG